MVLKRAGSELLSTKNMIIILLPKILVFFLVIRRDIPLSLMKPHLYITSMQLLPLQIVSTYAAWLP